MDLAVDPGPQMTTDSQVNTDSTPPTDVGGSDERADMGLDASVFIPDAAVLRPDLSVDAAIEPIDADAPVPDVGEDARVEMAADASMLPDFGMDAAPPVPDAMLSTADMGSDAAYDVEDAESPTPDFRRDAFVDAPDVSPEHADLDGDGLSVADGDCNDEDPSIHPGAFQFCDGVDSDCDPETTGQGVIRMNGTDVFETLDDAIAAAERTRAHDTIVLCDGAHVTRGPDIEIRQPLTIRSQNGRAVTSIVSPQFEVRSEVLFEGLSIVDVRRGANVDRAIYAGDRNTVVTLRDVRMSTIGPQPEWANMVVVGRSSMLVMESVTIENGLVITSIGTQATVRDSTLARLVSRGCDLTVTDSQITQDARLDDYNRDHVGSAEFTRTRFDGATLDVDGRVPVTLLDVTIENNVLNDEHAIELRGDASINMTGGSIRNNRSNGSGRAVYIGGGNTGGTLNLNMVSITDNQSRGNGGALYLNQRANVEIMGGQFLRNRAIGDGGAIYLRDGVVSVNETNFGVGGSDNIPNDIATDDEAWNGEILTLIARD